MVGREVGGGKMTEGPTAPEEGVDVNGDDIRSSARLREGAVNSRVFRALFPGVGRWSVIAITNNVQGGG